MTTCKTTEKNLTAKQEMFCREYLVDLNATQAAIRAGYSKKTANPAAGRLLVNVSIQKRISELFVKRAESTDLTAEMVIKEIKKTAFSYECDLKRSDKLKALDMLMRHLGEYNDHSSVTVEQKQKTIKEMTDEELIALNPDDGV